MDGFVSRKVVKEVGRILEDPDYRHELVEHNYQVARPYYGYPVLRHGLRLLIGHSRKSFMNSFTRHEFSQRDIETLGLSLAMCEQGVDILRVHDPLLHIRAYRAWAHARALI